MDAIYTADEIIEITEARLAAGLTPEDAGGICSDTRALKEGDWFIALKGNLYDGHDFIGDAFAGGALGCIVEERPSYPIASSNFPLIAVDDTLAAYHKLARNWRARIAPTVILACGVESHVVRLIEALQLSFLSLGKHAQTFALSSREEDALQFIMNLPASTSLVCFALIPEDLEAVSRLASTVQPSIVVVLPEAFSNFRLAQSAPQIAKAKQAVFASTHRKRGAIILADASFEAMLLSVPNISESVKIVRRTTEDEESEAPKLDFSASPKENLLEGSPQEHFGVFEGKLEEDLTPPFAARKLDLTGAHLNAQERWSLKRSCNTFTKSRIRTVTLSKGSSQFR
ncbi:unnamed protein product [Sphagnum balticum]